MPDTQVLVIDDEPYIRELVTELCKSVDLTFDVACSGREGVELASNNKYALVVTDLNMPGWDGVTAIKAMAQGRPETRIIVITGLNDPNLKKIQEKYDNIVGWFDKPFDIEALKSAIQEQAQTS